MKLTLYIGFDRIFISILRGMVKRESCVVNQMINLKNIKFGGKEMDDSGLRLDLISGLAEAFQEPGPQKQEGSRFNKATGTLIVSNTFINYALSHIDGDGFTKGKVYKCSQIENDFTRIISDDGKEIRVNINDPDFSFKINPPENTNRKG